MGTAEPGSHWEWEGGGWTMSHLPSDTSGNSSGVSQASRTMP